MTINKKKLRFLAGSFVLILLSTAANSSMAQTTPTKVIYFLAGPKDHAGEEGSGRHETRRDLLVLQHCIDSISNVKGIKIITKFLYSRTALNVDDLKGVDAVIMECSSESSSKD